MRKAPPNVIMASSSEAKGLWVGKNARAMAEA